MIYNGNFKRIQDEGRTGQLQEKQIEAVVLRKEKRIGRTGI